jgi:hypothetical protein
VLFTRTIMCLLGKSQNHLNYFDNIRLFRNYEFCKMVGIHFTICIEYYGWAKMPELHRISSSSWFYNFYCGSLVLCMSSMLWW